MEKADNALKTIGEMSKILGVQPHILRYWEEQFSVLNPLKRAGGRRYYRQEDAVLLHEINRLIYVEGFTIKGAHKYLRDAKKSSANISEASHISVQNEAVNNESMPLDVRIKLQSIAHDLRQALISA